MTLPSATLAETLNSNLNFNGYKGINLGAPSAANDALSLGNTGKLVGNGATLDTSVSPPVATGFNVNSVIDALAYGLPNNWNYSATGTISSGSLGTLTLTSNPGFVAGNWVTVEGGAGPACGSNWNATTPAPSYSCQTPNTPTYVILGTAGSTSHSYIVADADGDGGAGAQSAALSVTNAPATLSYTNSVYLTWTWKSAEVPGWCVYRDSALLGWTGHPSFDDVGQPTYTDGAICPSSPPASAIAENLRTEITAVSGTTLTVSPAASNAVSSVGVLSDDAGLRQAAIDAAETAASGGQLVGVHFGRGVYYLNSIVITGPNANGLIIRDESTQEPQQKSGPALLVGGGGDTSAAVTNLHLNGGFILGTGATDTTHPQQDGLAWYGTSQNASLRNYRIASMPHRDFVGDKPGFSGGFWTKLAAYNLMLDGAGEACMVVGFNHAVDDLDLFRGFARSCGQNVANLSGGGVMRAGVYSGVGNPGFFGWSVNAVANAFAQHRVDLAGGGVLSANHYESAGANVSANLYLTNSNGLMIDGTQFFDSSMTPASIDDVLVETNSHDLSVFNSHTDVGAKTVTQVYNNGEADIIQSQTDTVSGGAMTWVVSPAKALIARGGAAGLNADAPSTAGSLALGETTAPSGVTGADLLYGLASTHRLMQLLNNATAADVGTGDAGSCTNSVVTAVNQGSSPTCASLSPSMAAAGFSEWALSVSGTYGAITTSVPELAQCTTAHNAGHVAKLWCVIDTAGGSCTTAPQFNIANTTAGTSGTALTCPTGTPNSTNNTQTLAFAAGNTLCLERTANGATCTAPVFGVTVQMTEP